MKNRIINFSSLCFHFFLYPEIWMKILPLKNIHLLRYIVKYYFLLKVNLMLRNEFLLEFLWLKHFCSKWNRFSPEQGNGLVPYTEPLNDLRNFQWFCTKDSKLLKPSSSQKMSAFGKLTKTEIST
jgi:hypothetical protein